MVVVHVGDLIFVGNKSEYDSFVQTVNQLRHGDITVLDFRQPFVFCVLQISLIPPRSVRIDQNEYAGQVKPLNRVELIGNGNIKLSETKMRTMFKQFTVKVLWPLQTRYGVSFPISQFQTNMVSAMTDKAILGK